MSWILQLNAYPATDTVASCLRARTARRRDTNLELLQVLRPECRAPMNFNL
jgi:hypothetical protein